MCLRVLTDRDFILHCVELQDTVRQHARPVTVFIYRCIQPQTLDISECASRGLRRPGSHMAKLDRACTVTGERWQPTVEASHASRSAHPHPSISTSPMQHLANALARGARPPEASRRRGSGRPATSAMERPRAPSRWAARLANNALLLAQGWRSRETNGE
jgi:hypothetical protein